ncbi:MAG: hypothetical protein QXH45_06850 [Thermosphaera sp.]
MTRRSTPASGLVVWRGCERLVNAWMRVILAAARCFTGLGLVSPYSLHLLGGFRLEK